MFKGVWLKARTLRVLQDDYSYKPAVPGIQNATFSAAIKYALRNGGSEYDAAAVFLASQCDTLCRSPALDVKGRQFIRGNINMMWATLDQMKCRELATVIQALDDMATEVGA